VAHDHHLGVPGEALGELEVAVIRDTTR